MNLEKIFGDLLQPLRDGIAVAGAEGNDLEYQEIQSAFESSSCSSLIVMPRSPTYSRRCADCQQKKA